MDQERADLGVLRAGDVVAGYRVVERIGRGGMGEVFRAWDDRLHRSVAIKSPRAMAEYDEVTRRRFLREIRVACRINHPYVATVYDAVEERGRLFLVMEFIEGASLDKLMKNERASGEVVQRYAMEIAEALVAIHAEGIVHRDLKPANVMVTSAGHLKVMDFGVALRPMTAATSGESEATWTQEGVGAGTVGYMSPEQVAGHRVDQRSDLFALGILLYEAITGEHPFARQTPLGIATAIVSDPPGGGTEPQTLTKSGPMRHVVMKLLEKSPDARYESAEAVVEDLRAVAVGDELPSLRRKPRSRLRSWPAVAAVAVIGLTAAGSWWAWHHRPPNALLPAARPVVAVLPFEDGVGDLDGGARARMISDLLAADLGDSPIARTLSNRRVQDLLEGAPSPRARTDEIARIRRGAKVGGVIAGKLYKADDGYRASLDYYAEGSDEPVPLQIAAASEIGIVDVAAARMRSILAPGGGAPSGPGVAALTSSNDEARFLEQRARRAAREARYNEAIAFLEAAVRIDPAFIAAHALLADVADRAGYGRKAKEAAERAVRLGNAAGPHVAPRLRLTANATYARVNDRLDEELAARRELADRFPDDPEVLVSFADRLRRKSASEAWPVLERAVSLDPLDPRAYVLRGRLEIALKRPGDAEASWRRADDMFKSLGSASGGAEVVMARGGAAYAAGDFAAAAERWARAAETFDRLSLPALGANARKSQADALLSVGNSTAAEPLYLAAASVARQAGNVRVTLSAEESLAGGWYVSGRFADAERTMRLCVDDARGLDNPVLLLVPLANLSSLLGTTRRPLDALALGEEALSLANTLHDTEAATLAEIGIADAHYQTGHVGEARKRYAALVETGSAAAAGSDPSTPHLGLAQIDLETGHLKDAMDHAERALSGFREKKRSTQVEATLLTRARIHAELGSFTAAETDLDEVSRSLGAGTHRAVRLALARCALTRLRGNFREARLVLETIELTPEALRSAGLAPDVASAACAIASAARDAASAVAACARVVDDPQSTAVERAVARARMAPALKRLGRAGDAADAAQRAELESRPFDAPAVTLLAAWSVLTTSPEKEERARAARAAREAVDAYLGAAPPERRESMRKRPDLAEIERALPALTNSVHKP